MRVAAELPHPGVGAVALAAVLQFHIPQLFRQRFFVVAVGKSGIVAVGVADAHLVFHLYADDRAGLAVVFLQECHHALKGQRVALQRGGAMGRQRDQRGAGIVDGRAVGRRVQLDVFGNIVRVAVFACAEPQKDQIEPRLARAVDGLADQAHVVMILFRLNGVPIDGRFQHVAAVELHGMDRLVQHIGSGG